MLLHGAHEARHSARLAAVKMRLPYPRQAHACCTDCAGRMQSSCHGWTAIPWLDPVLTVVDVAHRHVVDLVQLEDAGKGHVRIVVDGHHHSALHPRS